MTNFLPAGIILDQLEDILQYTLELEQKLEQQVVSAETKQIASSIAGTVRDLLGFLQKFPCQPLVYTGSGTTEEVIARLEWLLALYSMEDSGITSGRKPRKNRRGKQKQAVSSS
ncbi:MAG TPA: hypothetical protein GXX39_05205 [Syntrophothermus lipocalidus]|uniref:Uncharacterized protein n=1 Tax=Syntrophothermus lipocalidus (strain DSM 12680 / TGB-C1) TaxID=643648 RepID=D7CMK7_SYNLT|nr:MULTISPECIES: hypothetical protein [Syntrophothermus]ADI01942.1 hypothetical protein Slip_1169 [Syntrophothermus lipocalidus DSM 12680]NSW84051.1 hypothetical protein [Syntrophothermus sp.]HHV76750.1 hypothetical protein [Syntrophothermus lipocalidus]HOV43508.1 hypothetical protein [Syntrophothermus lipocalidus]